MRVSQEGWLLPEALDGSKQQGNSHVFGLLLLKRNKKKEGEFRRGISNFPCSSFSAGFILLAWNPEDVEGKVRWKSREKRFTMPSANPAE